MVSITVDVVPFDVLSYGDHVRFRFVPWKVPIRWRWDIFQDSRREREKETDKEKGRFFARSVMLEQAVATASSILWVNIRRIMNCRDEFNRADYLCNAPACSLKLARLIAPACFPHAAESSNGIRRARSQPAVRHAGTVVDYSSFIAREKANGP